MKSLAVYSIKGGVGKTATAVNLAYSVAKEGYRTLIWDLDPQGASSFYFRVKPKVKGGFKALFRRRRPLDNVIKGTDFDGLDLIPADFSYRNMDLRLNDSDDPSKQLAKILNPVKKEYDVLIMDCAPNISLVSENVFRSAHALLVPMIPTPLSVRTFEQLLSHLKKHKLNCVRTFPFLSMIDLRRRLHRELGESLPKRFPDFLAASIPYSSIVELMGQRRAPLPSYAPSSAPSQAYDEMWAELKNRL